MTHTPPDRICDVLVVGGGPGGQAAARAARRRTDDVMLLDEAAGDVAWGAFAPDEIAAVVDGAAVLVRPRHLVLAPRPGALPWPVPGWGVPGVGTLDAVPDGPGPLVIAGRGAEVERAALAALRAGVALAAVVRPGGSARLRRLGVRVVDGVPLAVEGAAGFEALLVAAGGTVLRITGGRCVLHGGRAAETGLARALGARQRVPGPGLLETEVDGWGRTSVPGVFAVAGTGPDWVVRAQGRLAGRAAAGVVRPRGRVVQVRRPGPPPAEPARFAADAVVCPCEGVTAGAVRAAMAHGAGSLPAVKRATRAGMGRCQGRLCAPTLHAFCGGGTEAHAVAPRAPVRPMPIGLLMRPVPEPRDTPVAAPPFNRWVTARAARPPLRADVVVVGGGVVGLSAARDLAAAGQDVVLLDRGEPGHGASTANAGSLHVQLVPYVFDDHDPGPLGEALALGPRSIALWREIAAGAGESLGIRTEGGLALAATAEELAWLGRKAAFEQARGVDTVIVGPAELRTLAPALAGSFAGAAYCAAEGQIDPLRGTMALLRLCLAAGVRVLPGTGVQGLEREGSGWAVATPGGTVRAHQVLNAAGAHAGMVGRLAGLALPLRAVVQQVIATAPGPVLLRQLVSQVRQHLSLKQGDAGHMLIGGGWPGRLDADGATRLLRDSVQGNLAIAARVLPALAEMEAVRAWTGLTVHLDRGPVISATPGLPGLFHAVTSNGYTLGPIAGRLAAEAMLGRGAPASFALG